MLQPLAAFLTLAQDFGPSGPGAAGGAVGGMALSVFFCFFAIFGLAAFAFWIWMLIDAIQRDFRDSTEKIVWILVIVLTQIIGAIIYFFIGRSRGTKSGGVP